MSLRFVALFAVVFVAACSNAGHQGALLPNVPTAIVSRGNGDLILRVRVSRSEMTPNFVSPSTKGMTVDIVGPMDLKETVGLTVTAKGCKSRLMSLLCTLVVPGLAACPSSKPCYTATVRTYDAFSHGKIPRHAHELSADEGFGFSIRTGATIIPLVLQGIPKSILFAPSAVSTLTGSDSTGFVEPKCSASAQTISLVSEDADGNLIVGPGAPTMSLHSSKPSQFGESHVRGNLFRLLPPKPPAYPFGNVRVALTAKAAPSKDSGGQSVTRSVDIAYSGDICGDLTEFTVPTATSQPIWVASGSDGAVWFTESAGNNIGRVTTTGSFTEYPVPTASAQPIGIVGGPDGNLWFAEFHGNKIGRITPGGAFTEFPTPTAASNPELLANGPDGNLWFGEIAGNNIGRITTSGTINEFAIPTANAYPRQLTVGPDGNIWFPEGNASQVGYASTGGTINQFPLAGVGGFGIVLGPGNRLWVAQQTTNQIVGVTSGGMLTQTFPVPVTFGFPTGMTLGPDDALWFAEQGSGRIGRFTSAGAYSDFSIPTTPSTPFGITVGPDGAIWFAEISGNKIGRIF